MKKSTKGALAAGTAVALLAGGAGTLAYWNDTTAVDGGDITTGHLRISDAETCSGWTLDTGEVTAGEAFDPATDRLVPGDVISRSCDVLLEASGNHLRATVTATPGASTSLFTATPGLVLAVSEVAASPDGGVTAFAALSPQEVTEANDGDTLRITMTVTFSASAQDPATTQDITSALADIALTVTQVHA
ncbi:MAG TPA: alternate-type signal peptide domain-containing protein [Nocardioides sp.]|nr:alternate-type signal peptide domain-containing protein [Nocardioides sp.]